MGLRVLGVTSMNSFVGSSRHEALMLLEGLHSEVLESHVPQIALITGLPGSGKTRLIQEFFTALSRQQNSPAYWPQSIVDDSETKDLLRFRFKINPARVVNTKAKRSFSWFAQICQRSVENPDLDIRSISEAFDQFQNLHTERRHQVFRKVATGLVLVAAIVVEFLDNYFSLSDPLKVVARSAGVVSLIFGVYQQTQSFVELRRRRVRAMDGSVTSSSHSVGGSLEAIKHEVEKVGCPTVIVIDDWHAASRSTVQFVSECLELRGPCLIILARWLGGFAGLNEDDPANRVEGSAVVNIQLDSLDAADLQEVLHDVSPELSDLMRAKLAEHADGNPLICIQMARMPQVTALNSRNPSAEQIDQVLSSIPFDHEGVLKDQWRQLPVDIQRYLCTASVFGEIIPTPIVKDAFAKYFAGDPSEILSRARDEFFWLQVFQSDVDRFPDGVLYKIARNQAKIVLGDHEVNDLVHLAASLSDEDLPESLRTTGMLGQIAGDQRLALRLGVGYRSQSLKDVQLVFQQVIAMPAGSRFASHRLELCREQIEWLESNVGSDGGDTELNAYLIQFKYYELKSVGQDNPQEGLMLGHELLKVIGTHALKQDLILRIGNTYVDLGDFEAASECYNQILQDRQSHVGDAAWANLQICRVRLGEIDGAIASAQRRLLAWRIRWAMLRLVRGFIPSIRPKFVRVTEDISFIRGNIGGWYCSKGDLKRGLQFQRLAIRTFARIPHRAWIREANWKAHLTIGYWYMKSGQFESASEVLTAILRSTQYQNVISADSRDHVRARLLLISTLLCMSKSVEAQAELDSIDEDCQANELGFGPNRWLFELVCEHFENPKEIVEAI